MQKENFNSFIDQKSWLDCFGQLKEDQSCPIEDLVFSTEPQKKSNSKIQSYLSQTSTDSNSNNDFNNLMSMYGCLDREMFKRSHPSTLMDQQIFSNSSSNDPKYNQHNEEQGDDKSGYKKEKYAKQYIYSKNYRDKKKQQFKALQEQNHFLKKKVQDLQIRIRQMEMQNSRLKQFPKQKELSIQQFNKQFMQKISFISQKIQNNIAQVKEKQHPNRKSQTQLERKFIQGYELHGFSGSRKKQVLDYHMKEILEVVLRDSEKYLCMLCCKNKDQSFKNQMPQYQKINTAFFEIMELNESDKQRLNKYLSFLFPAMKQIKKQCSNMYKDFSKIIQSMDRVHNLLKSSYVNNLDFVIKRMKIESWFEYYKYHKMIRKLKDDWIQFVKNEDENQGWDSQKHTRGYKRNKVQQIMID